MTGPAIACCGATIRMAISAVAAPRPTLRLGKPPLARPGRRAPLRSRLPSPDGTDNRNGARLAKKVLDEGDNATSELSCQINK
jgi:hypothetical protein